MKNSRLAFFDALPLPESSPVSDNNIRTLPASFLILKYGKVTYTKNGQQGEFDFTEEDADAVIQDFVSKKRDLVIDFEHQSVSGEKAPAAGWISSLEKTEEGLLAVVKYWTREAEKFILNGEYRYFSPTLYFSRSGKRVTAIHSAALTNHPAMHGIPALAADDSSRIPADDEASIHAASAILNEPILQTTKTTGESMKEILETLGLLSLSQETPEKQQEAVLSAIDSLRRKTEETTDFLARNSCKDFAEAGTLFAQSRKILASEKIRKAFSEGKLTESMRNWAETFAETNPVLFDQWTACAPRLVPDNAFTQAPPLPDRKKTSPEEERIFAMLGLTTDQISDRTGEPAEENR